MTTVDRELLFEDECVRAYWYAKLGYMELEGKRFVSSVEFRITMEKILKFIREKRARKFLADLAALSALPLDDLMWAETAWFPNCLKAGLKTIAVVPPKSLSAHMSLDKMTERIDAKLMSRRFFSDVPKAREWLIQQ